MVKITRSNVLFSLTCLFFITMMEFLCSSMNDLGILSNACLSSMLLCQRNGKGLDKQGTGEQVTGNNVVRIVGQDHSQIHYFNKKMIISECFPLYRQANKKLRYQ